MWRIVVGVSGASGMPLARAVLEAYRELPDLEIHLVVSNAARQTMRGECGLDLGLEHLAHRAYAADDLSAPPASGSWPCHGMIVCPCSMRTLGSIANGCGDNLIHRSADVMLKERRPLILSVRETPLSLVHLRNMTAATETGAIIMPFVPAFYAGRSDMAGIMRQFAGRMLDLLRIPNPLCQRWGEEAARPMEA